MLGDAAYPLSRFLLVPFKDNGFLNDVQKKFNFVQSSARCTIERAFALLKNKFPRMRQLDVREMENACNQIISICCIHNFCISENERMGVDDDDNMYLENESADEDPITSIGSSSVDAELKRRRIASSL